MDARSFPPLSGTRPELAVRTRSCTNEAGSMGPSSCTHWGVRAVFSHACRLLVLNPLQLLSHWDGCCCWASRAGPARAELNVRAPKAPLAVRARAG
jgi:hypothetical protein